MKFFAARAHRRTLPVTCVTAARAGKALAEKPPGARAWAAFHGFEAKPGQVVVLPDADGAPAGVMIGVPEQAGPYDYAVLPGKLPSGRYAFDESLPAEDTATAALGWGLASYRFDRYKTFGETRPELVWPDRSVSAEVTRQLEGVFLGRDLINTPAEDLLPSALADEAKKLGRAFGARVTVTTGDKLLEKGFPTIHTVGRAAADAPRLIDLRWGRPADPKVTLVGKGVCFDSGGLDLKPAAGMLLMKKDMGGAAIVLGLAHAIMSRGLRVRLRVLVPAVENAVSGNAFRPLDVIRTRKGLTVEVGNTDAEGRLILCDALAEASREKPEVLLDFATLTGAARVALGTELPALFSSSDDLAQRVLDAGRAARDPYWRMPLHAPYRKQLESRVADLSNVGGSYGGAITAALFLQSFVDPEIPWGHVDVMAWNLDDKPGRPAGGEAMGLRAVYGALVEQYG
ncbi:MAG: leucyl aminopeptidase family protein [Myxococcota bacterium]